MPPQQLPRPGAHLHDEHHPAPLPPVVGALAEQVGAIHPAAQQRGLVLEARQRGGHLAGVQHVLVAGVALRPAVVAPLILAALLHWVCHAQVHLDGVDQLVDGVPLAIGALVVLRGSREGGGGVREGACWWGAGAGHPAR